MTLPRIELLLALLGAAALILAAMATPWLKFVLTIALAKGIAVLGIMLLLRAGQVSFGHALYVALGAYTVAFLAPMLPDAALLLPAAALATTAAGAIVGLFVARYREIFFGMLNLALSMVFYSMLEKFYHYTKGTDGIRVPPLTVAGLQLDRVTHEWTVFGTALALAFGFWIFARIYLASRTASRCGRKAGSQPSARPRRFWPTRRSSATSSASSVPGRKAEWPPMLELQSVVVDIAGAPVLRGVSLTLRPGGRVALIGRNGAGKTTTLRALMGLLPLRGGRVLINGEDATGIPAHHRPRLGVGYAPEERRLFGMFSVRQNLQLPAEVLGLPKAEVARRLDAVFTFLLELADLAERRAAGLSGGQGKMVALGRALMVGTRAVLLDEPVQGLAPALALRYAEALRGLHASFPDVALLVTESNPQLLTPLVDTSYVIERGEIAHDSAFAAQP